MQNNGKGVQPSWHPAMRPNTIEDPKSDDEARSEIVPGFGLVPQTTSPMTQQTSEVTKHSSAATDIGEEKLGSIPEAPAVHPIDNLHRNGLETINADTTSNHIQDPVPGSKDEVEIAWVTGNDEDGLDYASIFNRTHSLPKVPHIPEAPSQPAPLPNSQAEQILLQEECTHQDADLDESAHHISAAASGHGPSALDFTDDSENVTFDDTGFFQPTVTTSFSIDNEARFEEGLPLVRNEAMKTTDRNEASSKLLDDKDSSTLEETAPVSPPSDQQGSDERILQRKNTDQFLRSLSFQAQDVRNSDTENSRIAKSLTGSKSTREVDVDTSPKLLPTDAVVAPTTPKDDALAEMWKTALSDDDLLEDNDPSLDPSSFFEDDGEGFLEDDADVSNTSGGVQQNTAGFQNVNTASVKPQNKYLPFQSQQPPTVDDEVVRNTTMASGIPRGGSSGLPNSVSTPFLNYSTPQQSFNTMERNSQSRPQILQSTQSFADKSKGGYTSPYDLPMDISRPKKRTTLQQNTSSTTATQDPVVRPPPPRSSSIYSSLPHRSEPQPPLPQMPPAASQSNVNGIGQTTVKPKPSISSFFEELPATKPRPSTNGGKYSPPVVESLSAVQGPTVGVPYSSPAGQFHSSAATNSAQGFDLLPPEKLSLFNNTPSQIATNQATHVPHNRYSPAPNPSSSVPPPRTRYAPSPSGYAQPPQVLPFQPRTSSPLAQSSIPSQQASEAGGTNFNNARAGSQPQFPIAHTNLDKGSPQILAQPDIQTSASGMQGMRGVPPQNLSSQSAPPSDSPSSTSQAIYTPETDRLSSEGIQSAINAYDPSIQTATNQFRAPPRRSQTQSPGATRPQANYMPNNQLSIHRPASVNDESKVVSSPPVYQMRGLPAQKRPRGLSQVTEYLAPTDGRELDPLERWKGCPIVAFGFGGSFVKSFPKHIPRYSAGQKAPTIKCSPGEVTMESTNSFNSEESLHVFPGPLKSKAKKKDVLDWLSRRILILQSSPMAISQADSLQDSSQRHEERTLLWQIIRIIVEYDGLIDGQEAGQAIRQVLLPDLKQVDGAIDTQIALDPLQGILPHSNGQQLRLPVKQGSVEEVRKALLHGEREKAVWLAVDGSLWGHAMLIASTMDRKIWRQISTEFVKQEVKSFGQNTEPLAALYQVFAGNGDESMDELVPPSARAGLQMMSKAANAGPTKNALDGLNRWRESLTLILSNRTADDTKTLASMGQLLASYGRIEAAHICYILARQPGLIGGSDDPQAAVTLLGADHTRQPFDFGKDLESILLTEVYDFARTSLANSSSSTIFAHLQPYKYYHALVLAEHGSKNEAQQYCESITNALKSTTKPSPYYHALLIGAIENLGDRLRQAPRDGNGSWISKPSIDKVSGSIWARFNSYVAGEDSDAASNSTGIVNENEGGPFARIVGESPQLSRSPSTADLYNPQSSGLGLVSSVGSLPSTVNPRYAPAGLYTPKTSLEQQRRPSQDSQRQAPNDSMRPSCTTQPYSSRPASSTGSNVRAYKPTSQPTSYTPNADAYIPSPPAQTAYLPEYPVQEPPLSYSSQAQAYRLGSDFELAIPDFGSKHKSPQIHADGGHQRSELPSSFANDEFVTQSPGQHDNLPSFSSFNESPASNNYEPPSYEPPSYDPPNFDPEEPNEGSSPVQGKKNPSMMDDENDDFELRAARMRKAEKEKRDREAEEVFRRAAEADGKSFWNICRVVQLKQSTDNSIAKKDQAQALKGKRSGWFGGGWFGGGSKEKPEQIPNQPIKVKLGEESSFYFDKEKGKWINKKADPAEQDKASAAPPPPPRGPPSRAVSAASASLPRASTATPPVRPLPAAAATPPIKATNSPSSSLTPLPASNPASRVGTPTVNASTSSPGPTSAAVSGLSPGGPPSGPPSAPPSRPATGQSGAFEIDDLIGAPQVRKGGTLKKPKKGRGYVDVMAK